MTDIWRTEVCETLGAGNHLADWFMRDIVQEVFLAELRSGGPLFQD